MSRLAKILALAAVCVVPFVTAACGTEKIQVAKSQGNTYAGAQLFAQRCAGCHTLNAAGAHGSAPNIRTAQAISGPNFNVRCERPITRVLYAIENGGFSGAYMPQNIVVGQDARNVAQFVATYAGRLAPQLTGVVRCQNKPVGALPRPGQTTAPKTNGPTANTGTVATPKSSSPGALGAGNGAQGGAGGGSTGSSTTSSSTSSGG
jgi:mono/diheme cytochrome c family protein